MVRLTAHAIQRSDDRQIPVDAIELVVDFGRKFHVRDSTIYVIGKQEIDKFSDCIDLSSLHGIHVVQAHDGPVITVYRNHNFHRKDFAKPRRFRPRHHLRRWSVRSSREFSY